MEDQTNKNASQDQGTPLVIQVLSRNQIAAKRNLIPISFSIVILCFFMTFCNFRCGGQTFASISGINLVTGTNLSVSGMPSSAASSHAFPPSIWAILALCAAILGLLVYLIRERREAAVGSWTGAIGFGSLLILQFVIRGEVQQQGRGIIEVGFDIGYWLALLAFGVAGVVSYLRFEVVRKLGTSALLPSEAQRRTVSNQATWKTETVFPVPSREFDLLAWLRRYAYWIGGVAIVMLLLYGTYEFFIKHDPERDGRRAASEWCDVHERSTDAIIKIQKQFIASFASYHFKSRVDAHGKIQELTTPPENSADIREALNKWSELRKRYDGQPDKLAIFDNAYSSGIQRSNQPNSEIVSLNQAIDTKILTIHDPEPDSGMISGYLIGKQVPGWIFNNISEIKRVSILGINHEGNNLKYTLDLALSDARTGGDYGADVVLTLAEGPYGWQTQDVQEIFITHTVTAPVDQWIPVVRQTNGSYTIMDGGHRYWIAANIPSGWSFPWDKKYKGGPSEPPPNLTSSPLYVMSRESRPVDLVFKYFPNK